MGRTSNLGPAEPMRETRGALLVILELDGVQRWIPKSVIDNDSECYSVKSGPGDLIVSGWWAKKEGLSDD